MGTSFGTLLRQRRIAARLTQEQLAERAGLSARSVSELERGRVRHPRPDSARRLGRALELTEHELVTFEAVARRRYWADRRRFLSVEGSGELGPGTSGTGDATGTRVADGADRGVAPAKLPSDVFAFAGRRAELAALNSLLATTTGSGGSGASSATAGGWGVERRGIGAIAVVWGKAGVGKTALAVHWAHQVREEFPDGQLYLDLRGYDGDPPVEAEDAVTRILTELGVGPPEIPADPADRAVRYNTEITGRRILIVLDNASSVDQVRPLLPGASSATVCVMSRSPLDELIAVDGARRIDLDLLPDADATALLRALLGTRIDSEPRDAGVLAHQCGRLPLALRVAAELIMTRPATALAELVGEIIEERRRLNLLDTGDPHAALRTIFSWSHRCLRLDSPGGAPEFTGAGGDGDDTPAHPFGSVPTACRQPPR